MADKKISQLNSATTPLTGTETLPVVQSSTTVKVSVNDLTKGKTVEFTNAVLPYDASSEVVFKFSDSYKFGASNRNGDSRTLRLFAKAADSDGDVVIAAGNDVEHIRVKGTGNVQVKTGNVVISTAGKGIDFSANTNAAGMTSELLSWYEEGTFTPTVLGTTTAGTATYGTQLGTYTRIGRMVYFQLELIWSSGTGAGQMRLGGLPFTCGSSNCAVSIGDVENIVLTASYYMAGAYVSANSTQISLRECQVGGGGNNPITYDAAGTIRVGGCYYV